MKARDLAALAALGIAGKYAYDKFGGKGEAKKDNYDREGGNRYSSPVVENDSAEVEVPRYVRDRVDRTADIEAEAGEAAMPAAQPRSRVDRSAELQAEFGPKAAAAQSGDGGAAARALLKKKSSGPAAPAAVAPAPAVVADDYPSQHYGPKPVYDSNAPVEQRLEALNAANGAASESARTTDALANTSRAAVMVDRANRANPTAMRASGASTPSAKMTDKLAVGSRANQAAYLAQKLAAAPAAPAVVPTPAIVPTPAAAPAAQKFTYTKDQYGNIVRSDGKVSSTIFSAGQQGNAARNGMKRGGVVKMASGGLASSKMSKPSGASRGDGIAQRGRTRGTLR